MSKLVLGLDVGIASVGWGIIDYDNNNIVDCGVRLFPERDTKSNEDRRSFRSSRRLIRRREHRLERIKKILRENNIIDDNFKNLDNPYEIRCKGLNERLTNEELATAILHLAKRRGVTGKWTIEEDKKKTDDSESTKGILSNNTKELKNKYICELQLERLNEDGKIRGNQNCFTTEQYIKELDKIFENQNLRSEIKEEIRNIIKDRREYYEGPGNSKSLTPYGRFILKDGEVVEINFIDKMRGTCTLFPKEKRAPKNSYSACLYNFLNDLNNLTIEGEHLTPELKKHLIDEYIDKKGSISIEQLRKELDVEDISLIHGFRIDKKNEPLITTFDTYKKCLGLIKKQDLNPCVCEDKKLFDQISDILTSYKGIDERKRELEKLDQRLNSNDIEILANLSGFTQYHSLSFKALNLFIDELMNTSDNQMQIMQKNHWFGEEKNYFGLKNIPFNNELILSNVAKRSQKEAIKVVNAVREKYGELDSIVIEMAREKNSEDKKKRIKEAQKRGEQIAQQINELLKGKSINDLTKQKVRLYMEQEGKTIYSGEPIDLNTLINDKYAYEIDHIIPISISLNDSFNNKVLASHKENQDKGQKSPFQYFKSGKAKGTYEEFKKRIMANKNISWRKKQNLFDERDINKYEVKKDFINRNLVDTRYATRGILNTLQDYFEDNEINTKVYTINGAVTSVFRKKARLNKDRDKDASHHAVDALVIASIKKMKLMNNLLEVGLEKDLTYNKTTGEVITEENEKDFFDEQFLSFISNLKNVNPKFSHRIDTKVNQSLADQTIYGTRTYENQEYVIGKYKNIYDKDGEKVTKLFRDGKAEDKLLIAKHDRQTFEILKQVVENYKNENNAFAAYLKDQKDYVRKYAKKGNGAIITNLKYIDGKIGENVIDLTHKYNKSKNKRVIMKQLNPYRNDIYRAIDGTYKMLNVKQIDVTVTKDRCYISKDTYNELKKQHNILDSDVFQFSLYKDSIINVDGLIVRYAGIQNIKYGLINYKNINNAKIYDENNEIVRQPYINIKSAKVFEKYDVDILGRMYKSKNETCKLEIKML